MAIRFQCGSCSQPIEVDDEWASKAVACPYCRKTIVAPAVTTIGDLARIPTASPAGPPPHAPPTYAPTTLEAGPFAAPASRNTTAVVALVLAITTLALLFGARTILVAHRLELQDFMEMSKAGGGSFAQSMEIQKKFMERYPNAASWMLPAGLLMLAAGVTWMATVVCGVIGIRRPTRRGSATGALVIAAIIPFIFCCSGMFLGGG